MGRGGCSLLVVEEVVGEVDQSFVDDQEGAQLLGQWAAAELAKHRVQQAVVERLEAVRLQHLT
jgi:hypothetical protein